MLVSELLVERRLQRTRIMYHGTSSVFLPSIMKYGLLPYVPHKSYGAGEPESHSLGGVYLSADDEIAQFAAYDAVQFHGGEPIIITVQYVIGSGGLDEDLIFSSFIGIGRSNLYKNRQRVDFETFLKKSVSSAIEEFTRHGKPTISTKKFIEEFFTMMYKRIVDTIIPNTMTETVMLDQVLREIIVDILESTKDPSMINVVRVTRPIKFRGKTRITQIVNTRTGEILYRKDK